VAGAQRFMPLADLFVLSSAWEGFPNVVGEALAAGTPVVSTDCRSGPREILGDSEYGRLAPPRQPAALARAILEELADPHPRELLLRRAGDFTIARAADAYLSLLAPQVDVAQPARPRGAASKRKARL
jgi:glycosyltransferase involved in cell wall biosynthesis